MGQDSLTLVHGELHSEQRGIVVVGNVEHALLRIQELAHVAREIHGLAILDGSDGNLLDSLHRKIDIEPVVSVIDMAVIVDFIDLAIFSSRVVHEHDIVVVESLSHELLIEGYRCVRGAADELSLGVISRPLEFLRWHSEAEGKNPVNVREHVLLDCLEPCRYVLEGCLCLLALERSEACRLIGLAEKESALAEDCLELGGHLGGIVAAVGLRHCIRRNDSVFQGQVGHSGKLPSVTYRVGE